MPCAADYWMFKTQFPRSRHRHIDGAPISTPWPAGDTALHVAPSEIYNLLVVEDITWEKPYPAIVRSWTNSWAEFTPFLRSDKAMRTMDCTTNTNESLNARIRRAVNAPGHFSNVLWNLNCQDRADRP
jgi:mutator family transposase